MDLGIFCKETLGIESKNDSGLKACTMRNGKKRAVEAVEISANIMGLNNLTNLLEIYMIPSCELQVAQD